MAFKDAINEYGKEINASFVCGGETYAGEQIISMNPHYEGSLIGAFMKCLDIEVDGTVADGDVVSAPKFGAKAPGDAEYSYVTYGTYIVKEREYSDESSTTSLECYDLMIQSMIPYDLALNYKNGITVKSLLDAICNRLGWTKGYTTFTNSSMVIGEEKYDSSYTFRDVLNEIAQVAAGAIGFVGDSLCVIYPKETGETINAENLKRLKIGKKYGPVNSIVLGRKPQEDNIYRKDDASIQANGLTEIRIDDNQIMDSRREDFIVAIANRLFGLEFYLYELESFGIGYLNFCDVFNLETLDGTSHRAIMLCDDLNITQGVDESCRVEEPSETVTDYKAASETDRSLRKTMLMVDKQEQKITSLVSRVEEVEKNSIDIDVGGTNLVIGTNNGQKNWSYYSEGGSIEVLEETSDDGTSGVQFKCTSTPSGWAGFNFNSPKTLHKLSSNENYVLSFDLKTTSSVTPIFSIANPDATGFIVSLTYCEAVAGDQKWHRVELPFSTGDLSTTYIGEQRICFNGFSKTGTFSFKNLKIERGTTATDWSPAPEDISDDIETISKATHEQVTSVLQTCNELVSTAKESLVTKGEFGEYTESVSTQFSQTAREFNMKFETAQGDISAVSEDLRNKYAERIKYIRFVDGKIILGEENNPLILTISNEKLSFTQDGAEVAYFANNKLYITNAEILTEMKIGSWGFVPGMNGNLSFKKVKS